jgi:hypothetical protein
VELVPEVLAQIGDRHYTCRGLTAWHDSNGLLTFSVALPI